jgi:glycosyltransferase involved in cell wall biosynthesis
LALARYTWPSIASAAAGAIEKLARTKATAPARKFVLALNDYDSFEAVGGGGTRTRGLYAAVQEWSPVILVCFSWNGNLQARKCADGITVIEVPKAPEHVNDNQRAYSVFHVAVDDIVASRHCLANPWLGAVYRILRTSARCIVVEHCYMVGLPRAWGDRFVYSSQNNETELKARLLDQHPWKAELLRDVEALERFAVERSAATVAVSRDEAASLVRGKRTSGPVVVVPNGATAPETGRAVVERQGTLRSEIGDRSVVFLGSAHPPNVEAARYILEQIAPQCPDVRFHFVGSVCGAVRGEPANVRLWGVVDEVTKSAVLQSSMLAINPVISGSGSNVKLADYLGNGLYVVTTEFGARGYPPSIREHVEVVPLEGFAAAIRSVLSRPELHSALARSARRDLFDRELAMQGLATRFVSLLKGLERTRKKLLFVTYRYTAPPLGGAEAYLEKLLEALGRSGEFDVDVVAPEVSGIHNRMRFSETYSFDPECAAPVDIPNVRFARFPADVPERDWIDACLRKAWRAQPRFERALSRRLAGRYDASGLAWGWSDPSGDKGHASRQAYTECGMFLGAPGPVHLAGYAHTPVVITARQANQIAAGPWTVDGNFRLDFEADAGELVFDTSAVEQECDPRPVGFLLNRVTLAARPVDLASPTLAQRHLPDLDALTTFRFLDQSGEEARGAQDVRLTDGRGPWSASMEQFLSDHVADYDLVVTHNNVFRPAVIAIREAKKHGVPSILIPHAHLDDDFYHFPDLLESARDASLVLAAPKAACGFLAEKGCNVRYLPAGCDTREEFSPQDIESFRTVFPSDVPFILVLGRKTGAKGYGKIIAAVEQLNREGNRVHAVLIGPDDDGAPVDSPNASYLGRQPRSVVRGALQCCIALCNMSSSESFGIVLLEAWLAGKPVIANKDCAAFRDLAIDGDNALMVGKDQLQEAIRTLLSQPELRTRLASNGKAVTSQFDWAAVGGRFVEICLELASGGGGPPKGVSEGRSIKGTSGAFGAVGRAAHVTQKTAKQILVDVSSLVLQDHRSGIQRAVRSIMLETLLFPPRGYRIEPVYSAMDGQRERYRYARRWTVQFLGASSDGIDDDWCDVRSGDVFLALDLTYNAPFAQGSLYQEWRDLGVSFVFVVYDLLPVRLPQSFPPGVEAAHAAWLAVAAQGDTAVCISKAVADDLRAWLQEHPAEHGKPADIGWFHLGGDIENSVPTLGLSKDAASVLGQLQARPSFLMVGTLEPRKGHGQVLAAVELLWRHEVDVNLVIVGKMGWMADALVDRLNAHPESGHRLFWLQGISDEYLETIYAASTCLIAASMNEGFGLPLIEAARHKLPIIARDIPVFREVAGEHAFYFTGQDADSLAEAVQDWLELRSNSQAPRSDAMPWLTWKQSAERLMQIVLKDDLADVCITSTHVKSPLQKLPQLVGFPNV